jgi:hypothetical protein
LTGGTVGGGVVGGGELVVGGGAVGGAATGSCVTVLVPLAGAFGTLAVGLLDTGMPGVDTGLPKVVRTSLWLGW